MDSIRLLIAALTIFAALAFLSKLLPENTPPVLRVLAYALSTIAIVVGALVLFNLGRRRPPPGPTFAELQAQGLIESIEFRATRAFEVEEFEDEGLQYFIELADGSVLFLNGRYLYQFLPESQGGAKGSMTTMFPSTEFTLLKHRTEPWISDVVCRGTPLKLDFVASGYPKGWLDRDELPHNAQIFSDRTYDQIKAEFAELRTAPINLL
jgi:hypothetical protein